MRNHLSKKNWKLILLALGMLALTLVVTGCASTNGTSVAPISHTSGNWWDRYIVYYISQFILWIASLVHDALYQAMRLNLIPNNEATRKLADKTFYSILKDNGVFAIRRSVWYFAVRVFGRFFYKKKQGNDIILHS